MRVAVTGGAGHIGSHLVEQLVAHPRVERVSVLDDLSTGDARNLAAVASAIDLTIGSVTDRSAVEHVVDGADVVFHLAAAVGVPHVLADATSAIATNVDGTRAVVRACRERGARLVFASTSEVYGKTPKVPMGEDDELVFGAPTSPRWSYALAKALDEHLVLEAGRQGLEVTVLRYFNSFGPRAALDGDGSVVARFVLQALRGEPITVHGDGSQVRCFTYVGDIARATLLAGTVPETIGAVCNVGTAAPMTMLELAGAVGGAVGVGTKIVHVDPRDRYGDGFDETHTRIPSTERLTKLTGWSPEVEFADGLARTVAWCRDRLGFFGTGARR